MKENEFFAHYDTGAGGFKIHTYDSVVEFRRREMFDHKHLDFEISLILEGSGVYRFKDFDCRFNKGDVFVLGSNQVHCITEVDGDCGMKLFNIQFESRLFWDSSSSVLNERHLQLFNNRCQRFESSSDISERMRRRIEELRIETHERTAGHEIRIYAALIALIGELVSIYELPQIDVQSSDYSSIGQAMRYIDEHLADDLTLDGISAEAGYSKNYFSALFTSLNGLSPWDYIIIRRIEHGKRLLSAPHASITEVACKCGYRNISNFNRQFKRLAGCTPREYAQAHKS